MNNTIDISDNKILKLTNVITILADVRNIVEFNRIAENLNNYIKSKGATPIGPIIQKTVYDVNDDGQLEIRFYLMRQSNNYIHGIESPYEIQPVLRVPKCMYAHYIGPESKLKLAYDKIEIVAFENNIELSNERYTILVDNQEDKVVTDVFVQKKIEE